MSSGKTVISHTTVQTLRAITAATALCDGYDIGVINGVSMILSKSYPSTTISAMVSVMPLFVGVGALTGALLADKFGRKHVLIFSYILLILGAVLMGIPAPIWLLFVGRGIVGTGIGIGGVVAIVYMAEIAPTKTRGSLVGQEALFLSCGLLLGYLSNYALIHVENNYHVMLGLGAVLPTVCLIALLTIGKKLPESPHWERMLTSPGSSAPVSGTEEGEGVALVTRVVERRSQKNLFALLVDFLNAPGSGPAILVGFLQPLCGIGPIVYFSDLTFASLGSADSKAHITESSIWIGIVKVSVLLVSTFFLIDRVGRRTLLLISSSLIAVSMGFIGLVLYKYRTNTELLLVGFCCAVGSYAIGWNIVPTVYPSEQLPTRLRTFGLSFITVAGRVISVSNSYLYPVVGVQNGYIWFFVYAGINAIGLVLVFLMVNETLNKPLIHRLRKKSAGMDLESDREEIVQHVDDPEVVGHHETKKID
jgi:MFS family permease